MAKTSLSESDLLLILEMCDEGIEKCDARAKEHARNDRAAEWDRRVRDRYLNLKAEITAELQRRRRDMEGRPTEGTQPPPPAKPDVDASSA